MKLLHKTEKMSVSGPRSQWSIYKTKKGIKVELHSLIRPSATYYYRDGNYPELPDDWTEMICYDRPALYWTKAEEWLYELQSYDAYKVVR